MLSCSIFKAVRPADWKAILTLRRIRNPLRGALDSGSPGSARAPSMLSDISRSSSTGSIVASTCLTSSRDLSTWRSGRRRCRILTLRSLVQSRRFDHAWSVLAQSYRTQVSCPDNVVPLTSAEFCTARRRIAHLLTMYGFLAYVITTAFAA